jgi:fibronectin type 3 domain-containing protein
MALLAGDGKTPEEAQSFEHLQNGIAGAFFAQAPYSVPDPPLYFAQPPWNSTDAAGYRSAIVGEVEAGTAVLSFVGHGGFDTWGLTTFMTTADAAALANGSLLPFMVNINCLAGGFHYFLPGGSLGEGMTNNPAGGAVASLAPSGLSNIFIGDPVASDLFGPLFDRRRETVLGAATTTLRTAFWSRGFILDLQSYTFLGDPATRIATPAPAPPSALTATAGNGEVTLSWNASPEPVAGYSLYRRATTPTGTYARVDCTPLTSTSCVDATVVNATTYYYYAVSRDDEGFEGRASNFNSDCDGGPDCVTARPINPDPPSAPAQPVLRDAGTGGVLEVSWPPNPETDVKTYSVHYGTSPGSYSGRVTVNAPATAVNLSGLTDGVRYYVALTATNTSGLESALSPESSEVPHLFLGIAPPRAITDLMVTRGGADLVLTWSRPLVDIYGRPTTVAGYRVYRGTTPGFLPFASPSYAVIDDPARTSFTDAGAASASSAYYYLVTAVDAGGLESGAGRDLPNGTTSLSVVLLDPSTARLSWSAVTTDVRGLPTVISHYQVHRMDRPVGRASLGSNTLFMDNVTSTSVDLPVLSGTTYFTVLAVDNRGNVSPF